MENRQRLFFPKQTQILDGLWKLEWGRLFDSERGSVAIFNIIKHFPHTDLFMDNHEFLQYAQLSSSCGEQWWTKLIEEGIRVIEGSM